TSSFSRFEEEVTAALNFIYRTQKELAACNDDLCLTMDGSATSYQLLGNFAAGQKREKERGEAAVITSVTINQNRHYPRHQTSNRPTGGPTINPAGQEKQAAGKDNRAGSRKRPRKLIINDDDEDSNDQTTGPTTSARKKLGYYIHSFILTCTFT
uniref:Uncharacterized protein n=1 Tax=Oryza glaberrima TaxID=4538 RepID=I1PU41_ORYGL